MGKLKEWATTEQHCVVCDQEFAPLNCGHEVDLGAPTCSVRCYAEYHQIMQALADIGNKADVDLIPWEERRA